MTALLVAARQLLGAVEVEMDRTGLRVELVGRVAPEEASKTTTALQRRDAEPAYRDDAALLRDCEQITKELIHRYGPGTAAVRSAARALILAIELYQQDRRRLEAEALRTESTGESDR